MIKKVVLFFCFSSFLYASGCRCPLEINEIFNNIKIHVVDKNVNPTRSSISSTLIPQIQKNKASIDRQNEVLEKQLKAEKLKALEASKLAFLLEKLIQVQNLK